MALSNDQVVLVLKALKGITGNPDQCFTAYDITKATRSLTDDNIRHSDVREIIHTFYDQGFLNLYARQGHSFWSDADQDYRSAQLFVPPNGNPSSYDPDEVQMVKDDSDNDTVLLQDSNGNPLITAGAIPVAQIPMQPDVNDDSDDVVDAVVVDDVIDVPQPQICDPFVKGVGEPQRKDTLFDLITKKLTKLPKLW